MHDSPDSVSQSEPGRSSRDLVVLCLAFFFIFLGPAATQQFLIPHLAEQTGRSHAACSWILAAVYLSAVVWQGRDYIHHSRFFKFYLPATIHILTFS